MTTSISKTSEMQNQKFNEVQISVTRVEGKRKPAFATFNRDLNLKNVDLIAEKMQVKGYRVGEPIQVINAEYAYERGISSIVDINKNSIPKESLPDYALVLDGMHRVHAASRYNEWLTQKSKPEIQVPAIEIDLVGDETITDYINEINCTKKEWLKEDYIKGAASVFPESEILQKYNELIKKGSNPKGYSLSTLNHIYCNGKGFSKNDLILLCSGKKKKGRGGKRDIIPAHSIEVGDKYIKVCKARGFEEEHIKRRYLITEFNNLRTSEGTDFAFDVFHQITTDDISMMKNENKRLDEEKVMEHFIVMKERLKREALNEEKII